MNDALRAALADAEFDWLVVAQPEHVAYVSGYRPIAEALRRDPTMVAALHADGSLWLAGPAADAGPVLHDGVVDADRYVPYGRFYFESPVGEPASTMADRHPDLRAAAAALLGRIDGSVGVDAVAAPFLDGRAAIDASQWMAERRARKAPEEIELLAAAARITEAAIDACIADLRPGLTERQLANRIAADMAAEGGIAKFVVVTIGERSALSDVHATDRAAQPGELVRFDIGCVLDGYCSDVARTAVIGEPDLLQSARYTALAAGEAAQLDLARPGVTAAELFRVAVEAVEANGLAPYRRHHCGHGIGREAFEWPVVRPDADVPLEAGMVLCVETPFYELGWGGMMVEDMIAITADGCRPLTTSDRSLRTAG